MTLNLSDSDKRKFAGQFPATVAWMRDQARTPEGSARWREWVKRDAAYAEYEAYEEAAERAKARGAAEAAKAAKWV